MSTSASRLTLIGFDHEELNYVKYYKYFCRCGNTSIRRKDGPLKSCGRCRVKEKFPNEFQSYRGMIERCYDPKHISYKYYGAKGITVCERWRIDFFNFLEDMGKRPEGTSIGRLNSSKNYEKDNCSWLNDYQQCPNRGKTKVSQVENAR